jgi:hypothetical protein
MAKKIKWQEGSFLDNLDKISLKLGYGNLPIAWGLSHVNWQSTGERDAFIDAITRVEG